SATPGGDNAVALLGGTTSLLLLVVFTVVNVALLVLRRDEVDHEHFRTRTWLAVLGALTCAYLAGPWARSPEQQEQYLIAGALVGLGILLSFVTWLYNRAVRHRQIAFSDVSRLEGEIDDRPGAEVG